MIILTINVFRNKKNVTIADEVHSKFIKNHLLTLIFITIRLTLYLLFISLSIFLQGTNISEDFYKILYYSEYLITSSGFFIAIIRVSEPYVFQHFKESSKSFILFLL